MDANVPGTSGGSGVSSVAIAFLLFLAGFGGFAFFTNGRFERVRVEQPIAFDHRRHVETEGLECSACHKSVQTEAHAGLPAAQVCLLCHSEMQGESTEEQRLVSLLEAGAPIDWKPLFRQPPHVFFSHARHVTVAGLECARCHGSIGQSTAPPETASPLSMQECLDCHEQSAVSTDCTACHR